MVGKGSSPDMKPVMTPSKHVYTPRAHIVTNVDAVSLLVSSQENVEPGWRHVQESWVGISCTLDYSFLVSTEHM